MIARLIFGAGIGVLVAFPALLALVLGVLAAALSQPAVLAAVAGGALYPSLARAVRRWAR